MKWWTRPSAQRAVVGRWTGEKPPMAVAARVVRWLAIRDNPRHTDPVRWVGPLSGVGEMSKEHNKRG